MKCFQKELDSLIKQCKNDYKKTIENQFGSSNTKAAWDGLKTITGDYKKPAEFPSGNVKKLTDDLNEYLL